MRNVFLFVCETIINMYTFCLFFKKVEDFVKCKLKSLHFKHFQHSFQQKICCSNNIFHNFNIVFHSVFNKKFL